MAHYNTGNKHFLGKKHSEETKQKIRLAMLDKKNHLGKHTVNINLGNKNGLWKGDHVGYKGVHVWVRRHLPMPGLCQMCDQRKKLYLANITGNYTRDFVNWKYICAKCHFNFDIHPRDPITGRLGKI